MPRDSIARALAIQAQSAAIPAFSGGDVTSPGSSLILTIAPNAVTYSKFQQVAASSLVGNPTGLLANAQGITLGTGISFSGTTIKVAPQGSSGNLQYNSSSALAGAANLSIDASGNLVSTFANATTTPPVDTTAFVPKRLLASGGRVLPRFMDECGVAQTMQPHLGRTGFASATSNGASTGLTQTAINFTAAGTATTRAAASTNRFARTKRIGYVSSATAGNISGLYSGTISEYSLGSGTVAGGGGFFAVFKFGCSDAATVAGAHQFCGFQNITAAPTATTDPSTLTNCIGLAQINGSANMKIVFGGSAAQTAIDLGANFPAGTLSVDLYELILYAPPTSNNTVYYYVRRINTGDETSGTLTGTAGTALPSNSTFMGPRMFRSNNATALAVGLDIASWTAECDFD